MSTVKPDRHLDPDAAGAPTAALSGLGSAHAKVAVVVDVPAAGTVRGQQLTWLTVNLLLRLYGACGTVSVYCPPSAMAESLPNLDARAGISTTLRQALVNLSVALADDGRAQHPVLTLPHTVDDALAGAEAVMAVTGEPESSTLSDVHREGSVPAWLLCASGWKAAVVAAHAVASVDVTSLPRLDEPGQSMVAAWFAASVGVGEVFKAISGMRASAGRYVEVQTADLWNGVVVDGLDALAGVDGPREGLSLPPHWVAGAGAVAEAYLGVLSCSAVNTDVATLDHDVIDRRNLNRHIVAGVGDLDAGKALLASQRLGNATTRITPLPFRWQGWVEMHPHDRPPLPGPLSAQADAARYELVVCAVDRNRARTEIAAAGPSLIFSGATNGLTVEVGRYSRDSPWQCLGCASPVRVRTVEQAAASLAARSDADIDAQAARAGVDAGALREYLARPVCGTLGEREMAKFAAAAAPDWSVSFVSVAAGVLLAARVLRHAHRAPDTVGPLARAHRGDGDTVRLWMLKRRFGRTAHRRLRECPICHGELTGDGSVDGPAADATW